MSVEYRHYVLMEEEFAKFSTEAGGDQGNAADILYGRIRVLQCLDQGRLVGHWTGNCVTGEVIGLSVPSSYLQFENSAHMMMVEEPGQMLVHLVEDVRPLAQ